MEPSVHALTRRSTPVLVVAALLGASGMLGAQPVEKQFRINTYTTGAQRHPAIATIAGAPNLVVVWESNGQDGDQYGVFAQRYDGNGDPLGPEFRVNTYTTSDQHSASVASKGSPNMIVAWQSDGQDGDLGGVFAQRWSSSGAPLGGEFRVNTYTTSSQSVPSVAADSAGNFVVVWASLDQDGSSSGVFGQRYASTGASLGGEFRVNTYTTGFQGNPAVGMDPSGVFVVVWEGQGAGDQPFGIFGQRYDGSGDPRGGEFRVNSFTTGNQRYPSVDAEFSRFVVVWQSDGQDGSGYGVFARTYNLSTGDGGSGEFRVNTFTTGSQSHPSVAAKEYLDSVVVWQSDNAQDPQGGIFGQLYYGGGIPLSSEFRVNTQTAGVQSGPAVAIAYPGIIAWTSEQDPDGSLGIYGRRFFGPWLPVELQDFTVE